MIKWIIIGLVVIVSLVFIYARIRIHITRRKPKKILSYIFKNTQFPVPSIKFGYSYWWPTFELTFDTLNAFESAERNGLLHKFEAEIRNLYGPEFDPTRAISYLYRDKISNKILGVN